MNFFEENEFLWDKLQKTEKPIIVYGTGDGADKLFALCDRFGITVSAIFASNEFVRDREFHGYKVKSFDEIVEQFDVTGASISRHLSVLKDADLIRDTREGKFIFYELNASVLEEILLWVRDLKGEDNCDQES